MILTNLENIPGTSIVEHYGLVQGSTVRSKHFGKDFLAGFKNMVGGEIESYTELMKESRVEATKRMIQQASELGANAIVNIRYSTSSISIGTSEILAYGTAVRCS